jgi:transposase-like protein
MPKNRHSTEEIIGKLREVEVLVGRGGSLGEAIRSIGVTEQTYDRWRMEYGGLKMDQAKRLKELERENMRLRKAVADLTLDKRSASAAVRPN